MQANDPTGGLWTTGNGEPVHDAELGLEHVTDHSAHASEIPNAVFGDPIGDQRYWHHQTGDYTCAVEAQASILECLTGEKVSELDAAVESAAMGLLTTSGTLPDHVGEWLKFRGVECHENDNGTFLDVIRELRDGNKVIIGVNSDSLWHSQDSLNAFASQAKDHAIWLTGVDASDPHHVKVTINDSGKPDGAGNVYDLHDLEDVLDCPGFRYVATGHGPSHLPDEPAGYDAHDGIFHGLDQFLHDHALPIAGVAATAALTAASLMGSSTRPPLPQEPSSAALPTQPRSLALPSPLLKLENMSREARDRALRNL